MWSELSAGVDRIGVVLAWRGIGTLQPIPHLGMTMVKTIGNSNGKSQQLWWRWWLMIVLVATNSAIFTYRAGNHVFSSLDHGSPPSSFLDGFVQDDRRTLRSVQTIQNDGLVWFTPKPSKARKMGYEDEWLMAWKDFHYNPDQATRCDHTSGYTPYNHEVICNIPAYIPARHFVTSSRQPMIPRVIFLTWFDRRLGKALFTSLMTLIHHNPTYEFIFFDDEDVDRFVCDKMSLRDEWGIPMFSRFRAGAMRADTWRLLIIQRYGGVYVDSDISAIGPLPISEEDTAVSGVGCWGHLPGPVDPKVGKPGGLFEHWAMAFMPRHPYITKSLEVLADNLRHPEYLMRTDTMEGRAEDSITVRISGPGMYQWTLHDILNKSKCEMISGAFCEALHSPEEHCKDMTTFRSYFPEGLRLFRRVNLNDTITHKIFYPAGLWVTETERLHVTESPFYDDPRSMMSNEMDPTFCDADAIEMRVKNRERVFKHP
jgi:hypothetical protein